MKRRNGFLLIAVCWILGGMVFNGYHHHRESTEARLSQPCSVCKIQSQASGIPNISTPTQIAEFTAIGKVFDTTTIFHVVEEISFSGPRAPPVSFR